MRKVILALAVVMVFAASMFESSGRHAAYAGSRDNIHNWCHWYWLQATIKKDEESRARLRACLRGDY